MTLKPWAFLRLSLSYTFYFLGDLIFRISQLSCKSPFLDRLMGALRMPDLYQIFMRWSVALDSEGVLWKFTEEQPNK